jgi:uncharacterized alkaline shock family protein YloU
MEPNNPEDGRDKIRIVISEEALAAIAAAAVREVEGITALVARPASITRLLRIRGDLRYVKLTQAGAELSVELSVRVRAGVNITALSCQAQCAVKKAMKDMAGRNVARVNLRIAGADI